MKKRGKKFIKASETLTNAVFSGDWKDGLDIVVNSSFAKFDESVCVDVVLGVDPLKGEQAVRGSVLLPNGTGRKVRVVAFVKGENEEKARSAGADFVGAEDLIEKIEGGWMDFDVAVATPDVMGLVGKVAKLLGPRGLLPNKKVGTVTFDVESIIGELKKGRISFRGDKGGGVHLSVGRVSLGAEKLLDNLKAFFKALQDSRPSAVKGKFIQKIVISSSMGVGVSISTKEVV